MTSLAIAKLLGEYDYWQPRFRGYIFGPISNKTQYKKVQELIAAGIEEVPNLRVGVVADQMV